MTRLLRLCRALERTVAWTGRIAAWAALLLVAVTLFDVVTRRFFVLGSTQLQELEWHLHAVLLMFVVAWGCLRDSHVRVDLVRERLGTRARAWIEFLGGLAFQVPYSLLVIHFAIEFVRSSYGMGEGSASMTGLPHRWIIKSSLIAAFVLVLLAGAAGLVRHGLYLFGGAGAAVLRPEGDGRGGAIDGL